MREKSSSVLTSLSSRRPLRCDHRRASRGRPAPAPLGARCEQVLERPEHQRQRRAELVADVAEERRLGAVELGQRLGALALLLVGRRLRHRRPDLRGDEIEEVAIVAVEREEPAGAGDQEPRALPAAQDRAGRASGRGPRRRAARARPRRGSDSHDRGRPLSATAANGHCGSSSAISAGSSAPPRRDRRPAPTCWATVPAGVEEIEAGERKVLRDSRRARSAPASHASAGDRPSLARPRSRSVRSRRSLSTRPVVSLTMQNTPPTLPDLVAHRIVGDVEVRLLGETRADRGRRGGRSPGTPRRWR